MVDCGITLCALIGMKHFGFRTYVHVPLFKFSPYHFNKTYINIHFLKNKYPNIWKYIFISVWRQLIRLSGSVTSPDAIGYVLREMIEKSVARKGCSDVHKPHIVSRQCHC